MVTHIGNVRTAGRIVGAEQRHGWRVPDAGSDVGSDAYFDAYFDVDSAKTSSRATRWSVTGGNPSAAIHLEGTQRQADTGPPVRGLRSAYPARNSNGRTPGMDGVGVTSGDSGMRVSLGSSTCQHGCSPVTNPVTAPDSGQVARGSCGG